MLRTAGLIETDSYNGLRSRDCTTVCPDGTSIGRVDHFMIDNLPALKRAVKRQIVKDGKEFGKGTYTTYVTLGNGVLGPATHYIEFATEA